MNGTTWHPLRVGGGGWLTGIDIAPDGSTRVVRADTYGAYIWDARSSEWVQVVTANSMPAADIGMDNNSGVYEIRVTTIDGDKNVQGKVYIGFSGSGYAYGKE